MGKKRVPRIELRSVMNRQKAFTLFLCGAGILLVAYGMINKHNPVFIAGVVFVLGGYLLIRRRLKQSIRDKSRANNEQQS